jgi:hypothetical protein
LVSPDRPQGLKTFESIDEQSVIGPLSTPDCGAAKGSGDEITSMKLVVEEGIIKGV